MPVSTSLKRLLRIREMQEERSGASLERIRRELAQLHTALGLSRQAAASGRSLVNRSARSGDLTDRVAGLEEERMAESFGALVARRMADAEQQIARLREEYVALRVQRKQAETLIRQVVDSDAQCETRRRQQDLDEWFRSR